MTVRSPAASMRMTLCRLAAPGNGDDLRFGAHAAERVQVQARRVVAAKFTNVACAQAPGLAGHDGGGHLTAGLCGPIAVLDFGARLRKSLERNESVRRVQADADDINETNGG